MKKLILGMMLVLAIETITSQNDCVSRVHRYSEAPSITTIYPCNSILYFTKEDLYVYNLAILCDSVYINTKTYKLYAEINEGMGYPQFQLLLTNGDTLRIAPDTYFPSMIAASYIECKLDEKSLKAIREGRVKSVAIDHMEAHAPGPTSVRCENFLQEFVAKH